MAYTTIDKPTDYFNTKLYTGTGTTHNITGIGFQPDMVWTKVRSHADNHSLQDSVRGAGETLYPDLTNAEYTDATSITSFDSDGYTLGSQGNVNLNTRTFVSWNWLASNTTASNTDGSVTSTVSANTTAGFSICKFTNPSSAINFTFGHGLGVAPRMFIMKGLNTSNWQVYHESMGNTNMIQLNYTNAKSSAANWWNSTSPSSTVCTVGSDFVETSQDSIAYVFAEKKGYSKFGSYTGNGNADGPMIWCGFKPAFLLIKKTSANDGWWRIQDNKREPSNVVDKSIFANVSDAEYDSANYSVDFLSNGFKIRTALTGNNQSGGSYIFMAFAENPFVSSEGIPCTAR